MKCTCSISLNIEQNIDLEKEDNEGDKGQIYVIQNSTMNNEALLFDKSGW